MIVLKRLSDALRDGNNILAMIRGSAVNQDGFSNGLTAPNGLAQQRVVRTALKSAGFSGETIGYVETHGTGTPLGDPIEVRALRAALEEKSKDGAAPCWLGAVKTNIGHLESAAGIAGLIKTVLVLRHGRIPANCHFRQLNSRVDLQGSRLRIASQPAEWPTPAAHLRRAGVSSFGFGGTNAHVVLEAAPLPADSACAEGEGDGNVLLTFSARTEKSLRALAAGYAQSVRATGEAEALAALCRTANTGRARLPERVAVAGGDATEMAAALERFAAGEKCSLPWITHGRAKQRPRIAFLFTGQGAQYLGMGRALYRSEPVFKRHLDRCDDILKEYLGRSLCDVMFGDDGERLNDTRFAQPALVAIELALAEQWKHWGVEPEFVLGHSIGEFAAACVAGMIDLETVLRVVAGRGRLMASAAGRGAMVSVKAGLDIVTEALTDTWSATDLAAVNAPDQVVLSGSEGAVEAAMSMLTQKGLEATRLKVSHGFHSRLMDPTSVDFTAIMGSVSFGRPQVKFIPTGGEGHDDVSHPSYWVSQLRRPVRFAEAMQKLEALGADTFLEIGPSPVLIGLGQRTVTRGRWLASLRPGVPDVLRMKTTLGELFVHGAEVNLKRLDDRRRVALPPLPAYPFDRAKHWYAQSPKGPGAISTPKPAAAKNRCWLPH